MDCTKDIIDHAVTHAAFFKRHYSGYDLSDFTSLPTVNKKIMMENLTDYNTVGLTREEIMDFCLDVEKTRDFSRRLKGINVGMSSGTSGNRGVEIVTPQEERYLRAALFARFDFPKKEKVNIAFILRVSAPAFNLDMFGHKLTYISQLDPLDEIVKLLKELQPNVLSGPPSMLKMIAKEVERGTLMINPKRVVSYAEVLYPEDEKYLIKVFGGFIHEIYKCTEGSIAITCKHGSLHINEDLVFVELINRDGSPTPDGKPCHQLLITDLHKRSQPIIRHELNDVITLSPKKCKCGSSFRVIEKIQGRSDDIFWAKIVETGKWRHIFADYIRRAVITASDEIDEYQVIQNAHDDILVRLELREKRISDEVSQFVASNIQNVFEDRGCRRPEVSVVFEKPEFNKNSNKLIRIIRNFDHEDTR